MTNLPIPPEALQQHVIVLGKTRSGKSSKVRVLVEWLLEHKKRVVILSATAKTAYNGLNLAKAAPTKVPHRPNGHTVNLPPGERATLIALIQFPSGLARNQLTVLTQYKRSSRDAYIQRLREKGLVETNGDTVTATEDGILALPDAEPLPTGVDLQEHWMRKLPSGEAKVLQVLIDAYPAAVSRDSLTESTGFARSSRDAYLQRMKSKQLWTEPSRGEVRASEDLFS
jgi:hypothetical protein